MPRQKITIDGNEAAANVAYKTNEVIAIYPITPASPMGEFADLWSAHHDKNIWGMTPHVIEMQSEGGAAGAVHGALQTGSLTTTFTASQGLLLMIPNMYKIAGELTSTVFHIAARSLAANGLSIFGDHSDVMAARATGWGMLFANSVQESQDFALIAQASTLESRIPFLNIIDGFRTSHEINKIEALDDADIRSMIDDELVRAHRSRGLSPDNPFIRGTAQNPDVYFQAREAVNPYYLSLPTIVQQVMDRFAQVTGRHYQLFDYVGAADAEQVIIMMGSGCETVEETVNHLNQHNPDAKVGLLKIRLFRPFAVEQFLAAIPQSVKTIAVLDRTKEPGSAGEPLYQDVVTAFHEAQSESAFRIPHSALRIIGGRYGLSSKEFTPAMVKGIFDEMAKPKPKNHFTIGIYDDLTFTSLAFDPSFDIEPDDVVRAVFWGLGSDGTVSANKNSIKIIGEETSNFAQGYFVYDSKKAGARTISHLRFGPKPIKSSYLISHANFVAVHQFGFLQFYDVLESAQEGAVFLLNAPSKPDRVWAQLPRVVQQQIIAKKLKFYVIDAYKVAQDLGLGGRINTIMQTCFFSLLDQAVSSDAKILSHDEAIEQIKASIRKSYGKRGEAVVQKNFTAVDTTLENLFAVEVPAAASSTIELPPTVSPLAPDFVRNVTAKMMAAKGDLLPVSALPADGTYPSATTRWEKRNIAQEVPVWDPDICIQCGKCVFVCPHSVIRSKLLTEDDLSNAPEDFQTSKSRWRELPDMLYTLQVAVEDCTGCQLCVEACPVKDKSASGRKAINMEPQLPLREKGSKDWDFFLNLPEAPRGDGLTFTNVKNVQLLEPLFEFSSACAGCGETPYLRLISQLYGDHSIISNATGCSSIYGGNLPTTPWSQNAAGRGPAWSNSLFEDNAEFGLGMRLTLDQQIENARSLLNQLREMIGESLVDDLLNADQSGDAGIEQQRARVTELKARLVSHASQPLPNPPQMREGTVTGQVIVTGQEMATGQREKVRDLLSLADVLVKKSVWIVGGDGWAYDIGYGGLDHVLASGRNVNVMILDTEVYSNTGGQASKATPLGAVAKFAAGGKTRPKKDIGQIFMSYGNIYIAQIAMGADDAQSLKAIREAEAYDGPSLVIAYSHCIAHGIDMAKGMTQQKLASESGYWPLYRYDPRLRAEGKNPLQLDSKPPKIAFKEYAYNENRYRLLAQSDPEVAEQLMKEAQEGVTKHWQRYEELAR